MNIGFDLDKVLINFPPLIPSKIIEILYKEKPNHQLKYRIPSKKEQLIRSLTHHPIFRQPIYKNIDFVKNLSLSEKNKCYLISSRFSFLKAKTDKLIKKQGLNNIFKKMYFNYSDKQPHHFKDEVLKKLKLKKYVDDDLELLKYLSKNNPRTEFFWLNNKIKGRLKKNLFAIDNLSQMLE